MLENETQSGMFGAQPTLSRQEIFDRLGEDGYGETQNTHTVAEQSGPEPAEQGAERRDAIRGRDGRGAADGAASRGAADAGQPGGRGVAEGSGDTPGFQLSAPGGRADAGRRRDITPRGGAQASLIPEPTGREIVDDAVRKADDRLKGRGRPTAKPHEGDGELLAGPRPAQVDIEAEAPSRALKAELPKTDKAHYGDTRPLLDPSQRGDAALDEAAGHGRGARPLRGQLDMFVVQRGDAAPADADTGRRARAQPAAEPATQVDTDALTRELGPNARLVTTGEMHTGITEVTQWEDAAHIVAPLRKSPQEVMAALVLDGDNRPLAVIRYPRSKSRRCALQRAPMHSRMSWAITPTTEQAIRLRCG